MLTDVLTGWTAETLGGLTVLTAVFVWGWLRRHHNRTGAAVTPGTTSAPAAAAPVRTYTLLGARAADGQPVHLPSSRPAGTVIAWRGSPAAAEQFELTDALLPDGTYAAEPLAMYPQRPHGS
ncbi:hypothetical protein [Streptomyces sp. NBC_01546]|uniref:hypothetical protein n=1 Tax=Streptomyces sp. NBC_01546 TaxID=2975872 RepID=UPI002F90AB86